MLYKCTPHFRYHGQRYLQKIIPPILPNHSTKLHRTRNGNPIPHNPHLILALQSLHAGHYETLIYISVKAMQSEFSAEQLMLLGIFDRRHLFPASGGTKQTRGIKKTKDLEAC